METITDNRLRADVAAAEQLPTLRRELAEAKSQLEERREFKRKNRTFGQDGRDEIQEAIELRIRTLSGTISALEQRGERAKSQLSRKEFLSAGQAEADAALRLRPALQKKLATAEKDKAESERVADAARTALVTIDERRAAAIAAAGSATYAALAGGAAASSKDAKSSALDAERETMMAALSLAEGRRVESETTIRTVRDDLEKNRKSFLTARAKTLISTLEATVATQLTPLLAQTLAAARMSDLSAWVNLEFEPSAADVDAAERTLLAEYE